MPVPKFARPHETRSFQYGNVYEKSDDLDHERLIIGPNEGHVDLLGALIEDWSGPEFCLLYISLQSHVGLDQGRYHSPIIDKEDVLDFLSKHGEFLESFGGQHCWIARPSGPDLLVYDQHNVIYAYGPIADFEKSLVSSGYQPGEVNIPAPHVHGFSTSLQDQEHKLMTHWKWNRSELVEGDDP